MSSNPEVKRRIVTKLREIGSVKARDIDELLSKLGVGDVSRTQGKKAIGSLAYNPANPQGIIVSRQHSEGRWTTDDRSFVVSLA